MTVQKILLSFEPRKENVLPAVRKVNALSGFVSKEDAYLIADYFGVKPARLYSLLSGAEALATEKPSRIHVSVCTGPHCRMKHAGAVVREIEKYLGVKADHKGTEKASLVTTSCVGRCGEAPIVMVNGTMYEKVKSFEIDDILRNYI